MKRGATCTCLVDVVESERLSCTNNISLRRLQDDDLAKGTRDAWGSDDPSRSSQSSREEGGDGEQHAANDIGSRVCWMAAAGDERM
jgi:hypothetical protein